MAMNLGTIRNISGSIASGGTAQQLIGTDPMRGFLFIQNTSSADLWLDFGANTAVAASPSIQLFPSDTFRMDRGTFITPEAVSIYGATTGQTFTAKVG